MRKRTKWLIRLVSFGLTLAALSACGGSTETKEIVNETGSVTSAATTSAVSVAEEESTDAKSEAVTIEEAVLVEQDGITITANEYVTDSFMGDGIKITINNQSDKDVLIGCNALIVNDYMITDLFGADVAAGKKANEVIYLSSAELDAAGIDVVGKIEIYFNVSDSDSFDTLFSTDCVTIETSAIEQMDTTANDAGTELYNKDGIRIVGKTVDENSFWGAAVLLYCENTTDKNVCIQVNDMSVNGYMMEPFFSTTVYASKKAIDDITLFSSELEENGITSVDEVELKFHILDEDTYDTLAESDAITFSAK